MSSAVVGSSVAHSGVVLLGNNYGFDSMASNVSCLLSDEVDWPHSVHTFDTSDEPLLALIFFSAMHRTSHKGTNSYPTDDLMSQLSMLILFGQSRS